MQSQTQPTNNAGTLRLILLGLVLLACCFCLARCATPTPGAGISFCQTAADCAAGAECSMNACLAVPTFRRGDGGVVGENPQESMTPEQPDVSEQPGVSEQPDASEQPHSSEKTPDVNVDTPGCLQDTDCTNKGNICLNSVCVAGCRVDKDCPTGRLCVASQCAPCTSDSQCENGKLCLVGACTSAECRDNTGCTGGKACINNACTNCADKRDCGNNEVCDGGACKPGECVANGDCPGGKVCTNFKCASCTNHLACGSGNICVNGGCMVGNCTDAVDCAAGLLCKAFNCVGCTKDNECPTALPSCVGSKCVGTLTKDHKGALRWADSSYAKDCNQYRKPPVGYSPATTDGLYWIKPTTAKEYEVYCDMTFDGGGWTLILKIKGDEGAYNYYSGHWIGPSTFGKPSFDNKEAKLSSFNTVAVKDIWIRLRDPMASTNVNDLRSIVVEKSAASFLDIMKGAKNQTFANTVTVSDWRSLMKAPSLQPQCNRMGFNLETPSGDGSRLRIGIQTGDKADCSSVDSFIGIGSAKYPVYAGNWAKNNSDKGDKDVKVFVYLFVRAP